jgi:sodium-dependent dicarboxylate transporter 2/3/5
VATPPNAIIFGSGKLRIADMARVGFLLNLIGVVVVTLATWIIGRVVFDM